MSINSATTSSLLSQHGEAEYFGSLYSRPRSFNRNGKDLSPPFWKLHLQHRMPFRILLFSCMGSPPARSTSGAIKGTGTGKEINFPIHNPCPTDLVARHQQQCYMIRCIPSINCSHGSIHAHQSGGQGTLCTTLLKRLLLLSILKLPLDLFKREGGGCNKSRSRRPTAS
jgi:hypothetical protein